MKVVFTKEEVEALVLDCVKLMLPGTDVNSVKINSYSADYCVVTHVRPASETIEGEKDAE